MAGGDRERDADEETRNQMMQNLFGDQSEDEDDADDDDVVDEDDGHQQQLQSPPHHHHEIEDDDADDDEEDARSDAPARHGGYHSEEVDGEAENGGEGEGESEGQIGMEEESEGEAHRADLDQGESDGDKVHSSPERELDDQRMEPDARGLDSEDEGYQQRTVSRRRRGVVASESEGSEDNYYADGAQEDEEPRQTRKQSSPMEEERDHEVVRDVFGDSDEDEPAPYRSRHEIDEESHRTPMEDEDQYEKDMQPDDIVADEDMRYESDENRELKPKEKPVGPPLDLVVPFKQPPARPDKVSYLYYLLSTKGGASTGEAVPPPGRTPAACSSLPDPILRSPDAPPPPPRQPPPTARPHDVRPAANPSPPDDRAEYPRDARHPAPRRAREMSAILPHAPLVRCLGALRARPSRSSDDPSGMSNRVAPSAVTESAELVLPLLLPQDLAAAASACRALRAAVTAVTACRAGDAAHGLEPLPIPFRNCVDSKPYAYFLYTPFSLTRLAPGASAPSAQPWGAAWTRPPRPTWPRPNLDGFPSAVCGCACAAAECGGTQCACADVEADAAGLGLEAGMGSLRECGDGCACAPSCGNRRTQCGVAVRLCVVRHLHKGWGLHAAEALSCRQFVCEYAGEFLTTEEARRRHKVYDELASGGKLCPALIVIREHLPSGKACLRVNIDATRVGNVARFINHSCDGGNLHPVLKRELPR